MLSVIQEPKWKSWVRAVLASLTGGKRLMASIMNGAGLRLMERLRLRARDIDFSRNEILVRDGKGAKDRIAMLPELLKAPLQDHLNEVKAIHDMYARRLGRDRVPELPKQAICWAVLKMVTGGHHEACRRIIS